MFVWLNGHIVPAAAARVSALDRGLLHGDGVYDTWRTYDGRPFAVHEHFRRLGRTARVLRLPCPGTAALWERRSRALARRNGLGDVGVRLTITRGACGMELVPHGTARPTLLLTVRPLPTDLPRMQSEGIAVVTLPFARDAAGPWGGRKCVGHPSAVLGRMVAGTRRAREGLYVTPDGEVTEATSANLFLVEGATLCTPPRSAGILPGVTRDLVLSLARRAGRRVRETRITLDRLRRADEVFLTASTVEILPVVRLDGRPVGGGRLGPATAALQLAYARRVALALAPPRRGQAVAGRRR